MFFDTFICNLASVAKLSILFATIGYVRQTNMLITRIKSKIDILPIVMNSRSKLNSK